MGGIAVGVENSASAWASVFNLGNCAIGAGILSFPFAFSKSGLLGGVCICFMVACIEYITLNILMRQTTLHGAFTYQGLVKHGLGNMASQIMAWTILFFIFGSCVAYIIIVGDTFGAVWRGLVVEPMGLPPILGARALVILVPGLTVMLPISLQRSMLSLAPASTAALCVMIFTTGIIVVKALCKLWAVGVAASLAPVKLFNVSVSAIPAIPVMVFAYHCHVQAVPIYYELSDDPRLFTFLSDAWARITGRSAPHNGAAAVAPAPVATDGTPAVVARKLHGAAAVLATAYAECTILYVSTGAAGYLLYPHDVQSNILNNFPPDDAIMQLMRFCVGFAVLLHYPINQHVARSALYDLGCRYAGIQVKDHVPYSHVATLTLLFFAASVTTACLVRDLGVVFQVIGGLAGSMLVFVLPGGLVIAHCRSGGAAAVRGAAAGAGGSAADEAALLLAQSASIAAAAGNGACSSSSLIAAAAEEDATGGAAAEGGHTAASPLHSPVDVELVGWLLVLLGVAVLVVTLYLTISDFLHGAAGAAHAASGGDGSAPHRLLLWIS
eukprot:jgi/Ulvmu1/786/UM010_0160.1